MPKDESSKEHEQEPADPKADFISASDIERYGYCQLNWWLKYKGSMEKSKELDKGTERHEKLARDISTITDRESSATRSEVGVMWFAIIAIMLGVNGVAIVYFKYISKLHPETFSIVLLVIALLWIGIAVALFILTLYRDIFKFRQKAAAEKPGEVKAEKVQEVEAPEDVEKIDTDVPKLPFLNWKNMSVWFIVISIALALTGYMLEYPFAEPDILSRLLLTSALVWLIGTSIALFFVLRYEERMKKIDKDKKEAELLKFSRRYSRSEFLMTWFAAGASILGITGFIVQYQQSLEPLDLFGKIFLVISLVWMSAGFLFFYQSFWGGVKTTRISEEIFSVLASDFKKPYYLKKHIEAIETGKILSEEYGVLSMAILAMVLGINSILIRIESSDIFSRILEIVALIWLIGASFFLYDFLKHLQISSKLRKLYKLGKDKIEYTDTMDEDTKLLVSRKHFIRGRPDLILEQEGNMIPVEVKTGRVPRGPHFSHILQLIAYCILVEENYKQRPLYGLIRYGKEKEFVIHYDKDLENTMLSKIKEMRDCIFRKDAHRNHNRENKCRYCSRREGCPEKLI
jgi:CRISPR-associated exonuclease Cas4